MQNDPLMWEKSIDRNQERLKEAEAWRLAQKVRRRQRHTWLYCRVLAFTGRQMTAWGKALQHRFGPEERAVRRVAPDVSLVNQ